MAKMDPVKGQKFQTGNTNLPGEPDPDVNFDAMSKDTSIVAIITVDKEGRIKTWNHPLVMEKLVNKTTPVPYAMDMYDATSVILAIYGEPGKSDVVELGIWNPGPPRRMSS